MSVVLLAIDRVGLSAQKSDMSTFLRELVFRVGFASDSVALHKMTEIAESRATTGIKGNRTRPIQGDPPRPIRAGESDAFVARLREVIGEESVSSFSRRCGIGESVIRGYLTLGKRPGLDHLVSLADAGGVLVDWLAAGRGPRTRAELRGLTDRVSEQVAGYGAPLDPQRLRLALTMAEDAAALVTEPLTPERRADLTLAFYNRLA